MESEFALANRLKSDNWSMRGNAFEDLIKIFANGKGDEPEYAEYADQWKVFLKDDHFFALDKALGAFENCLQKMPSKLLESQQNDIIQAMIE